MKRGGWLRSGLATLLLLSTTETMWGQGFKSMQHPEWPPLPGNEFNLPVIWKGGVQYIDDRKLDYSVVQQLFSAQNLSALQAGQDITLTDSAPTSATAMMADGTTAGAQALTYGANDLWLELVSLDSYNQAWLTLHGTVEGDSYQLLYVNALGGPASSWTQGQIVSGAAGTNQTDFQSVYCGAETNLFFRAHHANITALVYAGQNGIEPGLTVSDPRGTFTIYASGNTSDVVVHYSLIGEAQAGIDYTNVSGMVTIPPNGAAEISIWPVPDGVVEGYESLTLKIDPDPAYLINPNYSSATITIGDSSTLAGISPYMNAVEPDGPPGVAVQQGGFWLWRGDERNSYPALDVHYVISGMASNGVDYATLNGTFTFGAGETTAYLYFTPLADYLKEGIEDVTLTLIATNDCMVAPDNSRTATVDIYDSSTTVEITPGNNAIEPNQNSSTPGQPGMFALNRYDWRSLYPALTIQYIVSGTASSGVDYTNISGTITFAENETYTNIFIEALEDNRLEGDESVTVTLQVPNGRFFSETNTATILIRDNLATNMFTKVVTNLAAPIGIDYHAPSNALIVSYNFGANGTPFTFASVTTNVVLSNNVMMTNLVVTNWSKVSGVVDEVKLATVKSTGNGFTNGEVFFGSNTGIGWLSSTGTRSNLTWCVLTNSVQTNALLLRGSLCVDQTGIFSNNIIAVTSDSSGSAGLKGVWRVDAAAHPTLLANIDTRHLEGVTTLSNNVQKYGPWAGKIITGDEDRGLIYTIDLNGTVTSYDTSLLIPGAIGPEDFEIIPPNQNLYICDASHTIYKLLGAPLSDYVGDLLVTQSGDGMYHSGGAKLFIFHWDAATASFNIISFKCPIGQTEHVTFAPIDLPSIY